MMVLAASTAKSRPLLSDEKESRVHKRSGSAAPSVSAGAEASGRKKTVAQSLGEVVWLFARSPEHQSFRLADLEWLIMTPVLLRQFKVFYMSERPVGVALWAFVNREVERRLIHGRARLTPEDWKSGEKPWLVEVVAPFGRADAMIMSLKHGIFPDREVAYLGREGERLAIKML